RVAEIHAFRRSLRCPRPSLENFNRFPLLPDQRLVGESLSYNLTHDGHEAIPVIHVGSVVIAKRLFVNVAEQVEGLDADVSSLQAALQETPEILKPVGVNLTIHVLNGVVNNLMLEIFAEPIVRFQRIAVQV